MHASIPLEDQTHEQFWRQLMRWVVDGVPDVVDVRMTDRVEPGEAVTIDARVVDKSYVEKNDATVVAYEVTVDATQANEPLGSGTGYVRAAPGDAEYFDPVMHAAPLRRIAEETGGKFYTAASVANIAEDVRYGGRGVTAVEQRELWNMPIILMALMGLACAEWGYRRLVGLV